jgi:hypothetical protein
MKRIATLALIVCCLCASGVCQYSAVFSSYRGGMRYDFRITLEQLANTPAWLEDQPNPPLTARRAQTIAVAYLGQLFADSDKWTRNSIALVPVHDRWVYVIEFTEPPPAECPDCISTPFRVVVMMDGVAVEAAKSPWKPQTSTP